MKNKGIIILIMALLSLLIGLVLYDIQKREKVGWISLQTVYDKFDYKKELEKELLAIQQKRKFLLDSLDFEINMANRNYNSAKESKTKSVLYNRLNSLKGEYLRQKNFFEEDNRNMVERYRNQVYVQLNQYLKDYSVENSYDLIFAADGSGTLMAASPNLEITENVVLFINQKYLGK